MSTEKTVKSANVAAQSKSTVSKVNSSSTKPYTIQNGKAINVIDEFKLVQTKVHMGPTGKYENKGSDLGKSVKKAAFDLGLKIKLENDGSENSENQENNNGNNVNYNLDLSDFSDKEKILAFKVLPLMLKADTKEYIEKDNAFKTKKKEVLSKLGVTPGERLKPEQQDYYYNELKAYTFNFYSIHLTLRVKGANGATKSKTYRRLKPLSETFIKSLKESCAKTASKYQLTKVQPTN